MVKVVKCLQVNDYGDGSLDLGWVQKQKKLRSVN